MRDEATVVFGSAELDLYGGFGGNLTDAVSFDIGAIAYLYPDAGPGEFDYYELYGSLGFNLGPAEATLGVAYAPDQASLGDTDNFYVYTDLGAGIPGTPFTVTGHVGYTDGLDRKRTRLNYSHSCATRMPSSAFITKK